MGNNNKMKICKNCNAPIYKSAKICPNCGAKCKGAGGKVFIAFVLVIVIAVAVSSFSKSNKNNNEIQSNTADIYETYNKSEELNSPKNTEDFSLLTEEETSTKNTQSKTTEKALVNGMRPEFKEAMDSYETFYDEYCNFMKKYNADSSNLKLISQYATMLSKLDEMNEKFDEWDESEMNNTELKYYLDVSNRIQKKLIDVAE